MLLIGHAKLKQQTKIILPGSMTAGCLVLIRKAEGLLISHTASGGLELFTLPLVSSNLILRGDINAASILNS